MKQPKRTRLAPRSRELTLPFDEWLKSAEERLVVPPVPSAPLEWPRDVAMGKGDFQLPIGVFDFTVHRGVLPMRALRHGDNEAWLLHRSRGLCYEKTTDEGAEVIVVHMLPEVSDLAVLWSHEVPKLLELVASRNRLLTLARRRWESVRLVTGAR